VVITQAFVFALICLMVFAIAKRLAGERAATAAAFMAALFPPLPYFGALVLTELWTAFMMTVAILVCLRAMQRDRLAGFVAAGVLFSATTLVRPAFVLLPFGLAIGMPILVPSERSRGRRIGQWAALALAAAITLAPWFTYNYVNLGRVTLSPAGGVGRGLWEGSWQGRWAGRVQSTLTQLAEVTSDRDVLDARVREIAADAGMPPDVMLNYVHEWQDIRAIWESPTDPMDRARARVAADEEYRRAALAHITADVPGWVWRRVTIGTFILWAADIPIRITDINSTPQIVIRLIWIAQVILMAVAVTGIVVLVRRQRYAQAALMALPLLYVTGVHLPLLCEARQSLPVKPLVLALAAVAITSRTIETAPNDARTIRNGSIGTR
jgi:4-amino-4-deoxy-L-arabinose transferase-like glycosyltransferase